MTVSVSTAADVLDRHVLAGRTEHAILRHILTAAAIAARVRFVILPHTACIKRGGLATNPTQIRRIPLSRIPWGHAKTFE